MTMFDWETVRSWGSVIGGALVAFFGFKRWQRHRKIEEDRKWAGKADVESLREISRRITRHRENNDRLVADAQRDIIDLYKKHHDTQQLINGIKDLMIQGERINAERHAEVMALLAELSARAPKP
jgi:uncharacterized protein with von Willebrand factor type A (vWA) domain